MKLLALLSMLGGLLSRVSDKSRVSSAPTESGPVPMRLLRLV